MEDSRLFIHPVKVSVLYFLHIWSTVVWQITTLLIDIPSHLTLSHMVISTLGVRSTSTYGKDDSTWVERIRSRCGWVSMQAFSQGKEVHLFPVVLREYHCDVTHNTDKVIEFLKTYPAMQSNLPEGDYITSRHSHHQR